MQCLIVKSKPELKRENTFSFLAFCCKFSIIISYLIIKANVFINSIN